MLQNKDTRLVNRTTGNHLIAHVSHEFLWGVLEIEMLVQKDDVSAATDDGQGRLLAHDEVSQPLVTLYIFVISFFLVLHTQYVWSNVKFKVKFSLLHQTLFLNKTIRHSYLNRYTN